MAWSDIYTAMAKALAKRNVVDTEHVQKVDDSALEKMAEGLGCPKEFVAVQLGGMYVNASPSTELLLINSLTASFRCTLKADRASKFGWKPEYPPEHIFEAADAEVELILEHARD